MGMSRQVAPNQIVDRNCYMARADCPAGLADEPSCKMRLLQNLKGNG